MLDLDSSLETALAGPRPRLALQKMIASLLETGHERDEIIPALEDFRAKLARAGRKDDDDLILELMDGFNGWCRV